LQREESLLPKFHYSMFPNSHACMKKIVSWSVYFLCVIALFSLLGPIYRSFLGIMVNANEGWNVFYADAAMGGMKLYPSLDQLITNNYPPLSFYCVGAMGRIIGDTILAGRLLSIMGLLVIAFLCSPLLTCEMIILATVWLQ